MYANTSFVKGYEGLLKYKYKYIYEYSSFVEVYEGFSNTNTNTNNVHECFIKDNHVFWSCDFDVYMCYFSI